MATFHLPPVKAAIYVRKASGRVVASGMARGTSISGAGAPTTSSRAPSLPSATTAKGTVSLRPLKEFVRNLRPEHPLRLVLVGEPDEMDRGEYYVKLTIWLRLLPPDGA
jgi:hypothetical protein